MKKYLSLSLLLTSSVWANLHLAPPDFDTSYGRAIFVDFSTATYDITYDVVNHVTKVKTKITFVAEKTGKPIFDIVPTPRNLVLDGQKVKNIYTTTPEKVTHMRLVDQVVQPGLHVLEMENDMDTNVQYNEDLSNVSSAFWIRDLKTRMFLEQYVPSNFEFDQYKIVINANFVGTQKADQEFFTNGKQTQTSPTSWKIEYPDYFTVSCPFFHASPTGWLPRKDFTYESITGRQIPITVYSPWASRTAKFKDEAIRVMKELEADYGPWGHPRFLAYGTMAGTGGMEHSGATATSFAALDHEMLHSYFAKGVMPANGNSGWIDEAIASWRDKGYQRNPTPGFVGSNLGKRTPYNRATDKRAYDLGNKFMSYLDYRLQDMGGLKAFLRGYFAAYKKTVITTEHFKNNLEFFSGLDLSNEFQTLIWGTNPPDSEDGDEGEANPNHVPLTAKQLKSML